MGDNRISPLSSQTKTDFLRHLLGDIQALEHMIANDQIESGITRIGAEQELCLVRDDLRPSMKGPQLLDGNKESHFTSELAQWNLEINLDPQMAQAGCLNRMHTQLNELLRLADEQAKTVDSRILMTGILPTIRKSELDFKFMTPNPRFRELDKILKELRGEDFWLYIEGVDEINLKHSSILFEACNTSFQVHLQVSPEEFADKYNWAQVLSGPVLAACVNSPMLLGKELWSETRIALLRQSLEIRHASNYIRDTQPRVAFGYDWIKNSAAEIFKNDVTYYKLLIATEMDDENSMQALANGDIPTLRAMSLHNGTIYKWNRACYGVGTGKPHLRIENRYLSAGPTPQDEMANAAFWIGLMQSMPEKCKGAWEKHFYFQEVRCNFLRAARNGLSNELRWFGESVEASKLILDELIPMAERGLDSLGIPSEESKPYLDTIEQRVLKKQTGSSWMIDSLRSLRDKNTVDESTLIITQTMRDRSLEGAPVHEWEIPCRKTLFQIPNRYERVDSIMNTNLVTVREDDLIEFAESLMEWHGFHHFPVENAMEEITGFISARDIKKYRESHPNDRNALVETCMTTDIVTIGPETSIEKAEKVMSINEFSSLPVVRDNRVIGIISECDISNLKNKLTSK